MNDTITTITMVLSNFGFPVVMCGALCFYVYTVQSKMQDIVNENTKAIERLIEKIEDLK